MPPPKRKKTSDEHEENKGGEGINTSSNSSSSSSSESSEGTKKKRTRNPLGRNALPKPALLWQRVDSLILHNTELYLSLRQLRANDATCFDTYAKLKTALAESQTNDGKQLLHALMRCMPVNGQFHQLLCDWLQALTDPRILVGRCSCAACCDQRGLMLLTTETLVKDQPFLPDILHGTVVRGLDDFTATAFKPELATVDASSRMVGPLCLINTACRLQRNHLVLGCPVADSKTSTERIRATCIGVAIRKKIGPCELLMQYSNGESFEKRSAKEKSIPHQPRPV